MMGRLRVPLLSAALLLAMVCGLGAQSNPRPVAPAGPTAPAGRVGVQPGDSVIISFFQRPELTCGFTVDRKGEIQLPQLDGVRVQGMDNEAIRDLLLGRYRRLYPGAQLTVVTRIGVNLIGEVLRPGRYKVDPTTTILDLIVDAGGWTQEAQLDQIQLVRGGQTTTYNWRTDQERMQAEAVQSGDLIRVPRQAIRGDRLGLAINIAQLVVGVLSALVLLSRD